MLFHLSLPHVKKRHGGDVSPEWQIGLQAQRDTAVEGKGNTSSGPTGQELAKDRFLPYSPREGDVSVGREGIALYCKLCIETLVKD